MGKFLETYIFRTPCPLSVRHTSTMFTRICPLSFSSSCSATPGLHRGLWPGILSRPIYPNPAFLLQPKHPGPLLWHFTSQYLQLFLSPSFFLTAWRDKCCCCAGQPNAARNTSQPCVVWSCLAFMVPNFTWSFSTMQSAPGHLLFLFP